MYHGQLNSLLFVPCLGWFSRYDDLPLSSPWTSVSCRSLGPLPLAELGENVCIIATCSPNPSAISSCPTAIEAAKCFHDQATAKQVGNDLPLDLS